MYIYQKLDRHTLFVEMQKASHESGFLFSYKLNMQQTHD